MTIISKIFRLFLIKIMLQTHLEKYLESHGKTQLRMAETEKYPHVTFFFSGGREASFWGRTYFEKFS